MTTENNTISNAINEVTSRLHFTSRASHIWTIILVLIILWGAYAFVVQEVEGHIATGMRDNFVWGIYIANFIFFMGIGYAGALTSGMLRLLRVKWRAPLMRIIELITVISATIGPIYIFLCIGRLDRAWHLVIYGRIQSPITWDAIAITTFLAGAYIFLFLALIRDFSILRDSPNLNVSKWKKRLYKLFSLKYKDTPRQHRYIEQSLDAVALIIIPTAIILSSILSWIFGLTLRPGWSSTIFGPYFVFASLFSGTAAIIIATWTFRKVYHLEKYITDKHFKYLGLMLLIMAALYGYFTFNEYFPLWYTSKEWEAEFFDNLLDYSKFGWLFAIANYGGILLPLLILSIPKFRTTKTIVFVSFIVIIAMWIKRYVIVIPTLETPLLPIQDTRPDWLHYSATWVEIALTAAGVAAFILVFKLIAKFVPIMPVSETIKKNENNN